MKEIFKWEERRPWEEYTDEFLYQTLEMASCLGDYGLVENKEDGVYYIYDKLDSKFIFNDNGTIVFSSLADVVGRLEFYLENVYEDETFEVTIKGE